MKKHAVLGICLMLSQSLAFAGGTAAPAPVTEAPAQPPAPVVVAPPPAPVVVAPVVKPIACKDTEYWCGSDGEFVRTAALKECVRTGRWTMQNAIAACEPQLVAAGLLKP